MSQRRETAQTMVRMAMIAVCMVAAGCASVSPNLASYDAKMTNPLPQDQARVCFVRQSAMLGAIVPHSVLDCGSNLICNVSFIETSQWAPTTVPLQIDHGPFGHGSGGRDLHLLRTKPGKVIVRGKPECFTIGKMLQPIQPNSDLMDAAYLSLPEDVLRRSRLSGTPIVTGQDFTWFVRDSCHPQRFIRLAGTWVLKEGLVELSEERATKVLAELGMRQIRGPEAVKLMGQETGQNARYCGTVRSGGSIVFDRPEGTMRIRVVTPGGDTAFAPDFTVEKGKKYVVVYTYGFSGVKFVMSERP